MDGKFVNACMGKSESQGGMNTEKFVQEFKKRFPHVPVPMTRKGLNSLCARHVDIKRYINDYYGADVHIPYKHKKYCKCVVDVVSKSPKGCTKKTKKYSMKGCYNPYAVCAKTVGRPIGRFECFKYMKMSKLTPQELNALERYKMKKLGPEDFYHT